jgi:hypothetical protein
LEEQQRIAVGVLLSPDIRPSMNPILDLKWDENIPSHRRNLYTALGLLVNAPSSMIGNGFRVLRQQEPVFREVLLGTDPTIKLPWLKSNRSLGRRVDVVPLPDPLWDSLRKYDDKVTVAVLNTDTDQPSVDPERPFVAAQVN